MPGATHTPMHQGQSSRSEMARKGPFTYLVRSMSIVPSRASKVAKELGIEEALGKGFEGKLALWQVMARVIDQGSRLSAVRLAREHAAGDVLDMKRGFDENNLYDNLAWL